MIKGNKKVKPRMVTVSESLNGILHPGNFSGQVSHVEIQPLEGLKYHKSFYRFHKYKADSLGKKKKVKLQKSASKIA